MPDVVINFATAGEANVVRAWAAQSAAIREQNKHLHDAYTAAMKADKSMISLTANMRKDLAGVGGSLKNIALGIVGGGGILSAYRAWQQANKDIMQQTHDLTLQLSEWQAKASIQLGIEQPKERAFQDAMFKISKDRATPLETTYTTATQLGSSGMKLEDVPGGTDTVLSIRNAMSSFGKAGAAEIDPKALTLALSGYLKSQGMELNVENLSQVGQMMGSLYKTTDLQIGDLLEIAPQGSALKSGMTMQEQLATASILKDIGNSPEEMATKMRQVVIEGGTTAGSQSTIEAMGEVGLKPEDVDMVGESYIESIKRWKSAFAGVDLAKQQTVLSKVFGSRQVAPMLNMMENIDKIEDRVAQMSDPNNAGIFANDRKRAETGVHAVAQRQEIEKQQILRDSGHADTTLFKNELHNMAMRAEGLAKATARQKLFDEQIAAGNDPNAAADVAYAGLTAAGTKPSQVARFGLRDKGNDTQPAKKGPRPNWAADEGGLQAGPKVNGVFIEHPDSDRHPDLELSPEERQAKQLKRLKTQREEARQRRDSSFGFSWSAADEQRKKQQAATDFDQLTRAIQSLEKALLGNSQATHQNTASQQGRGPLLPRDDAGGRDAAPNLTPSFALSE